MLNCCGAARPARGQRAAGRTPDRWPRPSWPHLASPLAAHIYLSVMRLYSGGLGRLAGLSLVAGIAVAEALHDLGYTKRS